MRQQLAMLIAQNLDLNRGRAALEAVNGGLERDNARLKSRCLATEQVLTGWGLKLWGFGESGLVCPVSPAPVCWGNAAGSLEQLSIRPLCCPLHPGMG